MFHQFTIVHLCLLGTFAALGLRGLVVYRGKIVSMRFSSAGRQFLRLTYSDVVLLFAVLSFISLDNASLEFLNWTVSQLKHGPKFASLIVFTAYVTSLVCALGYTFGGALVILFNLVTRLFRRSQSGH